MKILALYTQQNTTVLRRVLAPYSTLAQRGHAFTFRQILNFDADMAHGADLTVLPNWILTDSELARFQNVSSRCAFVYDLSDPTLLQQSNVLETLPYCRAITVPNAYLKQEVQVFLRGWRGYGPQGAPRVHITPSCLDIAYMMRAHTQEEQARLFARFLPQIALDQPMIGCFGPQYWPLVAEALVQVREKMPRLQVIGDAAAARVLPGLVETVPSLMELQPYFLEKCLFGLAPCDGMNGEETFVAHEYGIFCRPVITSANSAYTAVCRDQSARFVPATTDAWIEAITGWVTHASERAAYGQRAFQQAEAMRASKQADAYLKVMNQMLPHSLAAR